MVTKRRCSVYLDIGLVRLLRAYAKKEDVSISHIVNNLLKKEFKGEGEKI